MSRQSLAPRDLGLAVAEVLEGAAFLCADTVDGRQVSHGDIAAEISFSGPRCGTLRIATSPVFAAVIASNVLGEDSDDPDEKATGTEALHEILNMIVGDWVARAFGSDSVYTLGLPVEIGPRDPLPGELSVSLMADDGSVVSVCAHIDDP
ncbi:MAG: chemotaxis protein CheX [Deltaproteobacteria bacterium]